MEPAGGGASFGVYGESKGVYGLMPCFSPPPPLPLQFGGKLVSFSNTRGSDVPKLVTISQVVTEQDLVHRSEQLELSLSQQLYADFCDQKSQQSANERESTLWNFLKVSKDCETCQCGHLY